MSLNYNTSDSELPKKMKQVWITRKGGPEVLRVKEGPDPSPTEGEVLIEVKASGINFADILSRTGRYPEAPPLPMVPGYEVSGLVTEVGEKVSKEWVGRGFLPPLFLVGTQVRFAFPRNKCFYFLKNFLFARCCYFSQLPHRLRSRAKTWSFKKWR